MNLNNLKVAITEPVFRVFLPGDVRQSHADISKAQRSLCYAPTQRIG